jgi:hypothetical protein
MNLSQIWAVLGFLGVTLILRILGVRPGLGVRVRIAHSSFWKFNQSGRSIHHQHYPINLILSNIPYQGGGDYRGIYMI